MSVWLAVQPVTGKDYRKFFGSGNAVYQRRQDQHGCEVVLGAAQKSYFYCRIARGFEGICKEGYFKRTKLFPTYILGSAACIAVVRSICISWLYAQR